jgi:hypothetical protein
MYSQKRSRSISRRIQSSSRKNQESSHRNFLNYVSYEMQDTPTKKPTYFVAIADFALISHLKDKYGKTHITNSPGVLNVAVYTNREDIPTLFENIYDKVSEFISRQPNPKEYSIQMKECTNKTLPCILRVYKEKRLFSDFLLTTKPYKKNDIDENLSKELGFSIKRLESIL